MHRTHVAIFAAIAAVAALIATVALTLPGPDTPSHPVPLPADDGLAAARPDPTRPTLLPDGRRIHPVVRAPAPRPRRIAELDQIPPIPPDASPEARLEKAWQRFAEHERSLIKLLHDGDPAIAAEARLTLAGLYADLADAIEQVPLPEDTPPSERDRARSTRDREAAGLREKAMAVTDEVGPLIDALAPDDPLRAELEARLDTLPRR